MSWSVGAPAAVHGRPVWTFWHDAVSAACNLVDCHRRELSGLVWNDQFPDWVVPAELRAATPSDATFTLRYDDDDRVAVQLVRHATDNPAPASTVKELSEDDLVRHESAVSETARDADWPLGVHVPLPRHLEVFAGRRSMGGGTVQSWTTIQQGAAPSECKRMQEAVGPYHVVLVQLDGGGRTVGIWLDQTEPTFGQRAEPQVHRLTLHQEVWRYAVGFSAPGL